MFFKVCEGVTYYFEGLGGPIMFTSSFIENIETAGIILIVLLGDIFIWSLENNNSFNSLIVY